MNKQKSLFGGGVKKTLKTATANVLKKAKSKKSAKSKKAPTTKKTTPPNITAQFGPVAKRPAKQNNQKRLTSIYPF